MQEQIKADIKAAMIAKEMEKLQVLRLVSAAFTNELVSQGRPPQEPLSDDDCMKVMKRLVKQRKDSILQYTSGGRPELAEDEAKEITYLQNYLPAQMSESEIESKVKASLEKEPVDPSKKGQFVGTMMKELGSNADGQLVKQVIDRLIS